VTVCDQLRCAIEASGRTLYAVAKAAGLKPETLYRFMRRERDIRGETFAKIALALGLELAPKKEG
jgi:DNA-binding phage protein